MNIQIGSLIAMWLVTVVCVIGSVRVWRLRRTLGGLVDEFSANLDQGPADRALADWTRNTKITVCSVTGTWVSMTFAQLAKSPVPYRSWNVPTSVEIHPRSTDARTDQEHAKEHRG